MQFDEPELVVALVRELVERGTLVVTTVRSLPDSHAGSPGGRALGGSRRRGVGKRQIKRNQIHLPRGRCDEDVGANRPLERRSGDEVTYAYPRESFVDSSR